MVDEGLISREDAVVRIDPGSLDQLLHPMIDPAADVEVVAQGLNASPGAASGKIVFDADTAAERGKNGDSVILVRWETTPDDIHGMIAAQGILTAHGGMRRSPRASRREPTHPRRETRQRFVRCRPGCGRSSRKRSRPRCIPCSSWPRASRWSRSRSRG